MEDHITTEDPIKKAEQYEALKQILLRLLDEPQVRATAVGLTRYFGDDPKQNVIRPQGEPERPIVLRPIR